MEANCFSYKIQGDNTLSTQLFREYYFKLHVSRATFAAFLILIYINSTDTKSVIHWNKQMFSGEAAFRWIFFCFLFYATYEQLG